MLKIGPRYTEQQGGPCGSLWSEVTIGHDMRRQLVRMK
jgi:hypothetical protein